jgi:hypothetical protein
MESMGIISLEKNSNRKKRLWQWRVRMGQFRGHSLQIRMGMAMDRSEALLNHSDEEEGGVFV